MPATSPRRADYFAHELPGRAQRVMTRGNTRSTLYVPPSPPYAVSGMGAIVTDQLGHTVIDANNNYTALIHGHARAEITEAVTGLLADGSAFGLPTASEVSLAELLVERTAQPTWRFSNSGSEAVMTAIRAARAFTGRDVVIRFAGSYHGTADAAVSVNAAGIPAGVRADVIEVPQGNREAYDAVLTEFNTRIAAVLIDLMPNRAGLIPADPAFADHVRESTRRIGALMIVDEVITLRIATNGLSGQYGVEPDLITAGKIIGGGFAVGAVGGRSEVLEVFDPIGSGTVNWGGTFSANPVTMTAGRIAMELFDAQAVARLNERGGSVRAALLDAGVAATGHGSLTRLREELDLGELWWAAYERGVMLGTNGLIALSTAMTDDHIDAITQGCVEAVRAVRGRKNI